MSRPASPAVLPSAALWTALGRACHRVRQIYRPARGQLDAWIAQGSAATPDCAPHHRVKRDTGLLTDDPALQLGKSRATSTGSRCQKANVRRADSTCSVSESSGMTRPRPSGNVGRTADREDHRRASCGAAVHGDVEVNGRLHYTGQFSISVRGAAQLRLAGATTELPVKMSTGLTATQKFCMWQLQEGFGLLLITLYGRLRRPVRFCRARA